MKVCNIQEIRTLDKNASENYSIPEKLLMENAGEAAYFIISKEYKTLKNKHFVLFCGVGNNGGDGFVVARKLHSMGASIKIFILGDPKKYSNSAKLNYEIITKLPINIKNTNNIDEIKKSIYHCDGIIDAIFGTGLKREVSGIYKELILFLNNINKKIFSLDIPSGINGDSGAIMGTAIKANFTITFGLPKLGNILYPGYANNGKLCISHISFPPELYNNNSIKVELNEPIELSPKNAELHKKKCGDAIFISGASQYFGAPYFSALSFLKCGGGFFQKKKHAREKTLCAFMAMATKV